MANPYFKLFNAPGSKAFSSAGLIARLPVSMTGIGIITMLSQVRGSYWLAGAVAATFAFSMALLAPQIARAADRHGQSRVLPYATGISAIALLLLLLCTHYRAPDWTLFVFAALAGGMPSISAMVRARWSEIYRGTPQLHTAFSFESVLDEVAFIVGPPIAVGLSVSLFPEAGPLVAALLLVAGVAAFAAQKSTQPPVYAHNNQRQRAILTMPSMQILVLALIALGTIVGTVDVISVAFAEQQGQPAATSNTISPAVSVMLKPAVIPMASIARPANAAPSATPIPRPVTIQVNPSVSREGGTMFSTSPMATIMVGAKNNPATNIAAASVKTLCTHSSGKVVKAVANAAYKNRRGKGTGIFIAPKISPARQEPNA